MLVIRETLNVKRNVGWSTNSSDLRSACSVPSGRSHNIILKSVRQHNYFITQGNYIGYMFRLLIRNLQAYFCQLSHKTLCTHWDPSVFTSMEYIKLNNLSQKVWRARHTLWDKWFNFMYSMDVNMLGSQSVHSVLWLNW